MHFRLFVYTYGRESAMKTYAYLRVSTEGQEVDNQRLAILEYCQRQQIHIDEFIEVKLSSRRSTKERRIDELLDRLEKSDTLIVSELSRLGRSLGQIVTLVDALRDNDIRLLAIKEGIDTSKNDITTKTQIAMFGLFSEIERDLISQRTIEGLARAKRDGKKLGRPKGTLGRSKLDGKEVEIKQLLEKGINKTAIAKLMDVSRPTLLNFVKTRKLA
jgi:DNA invertase Pin-like site-specific DNA recombinase